ncbi:MAG: hypothetical protein ACJ8J0_13075 [Longimicrobiaceae bacterium]
MYRKLLLPGALAAAVVLAACDGGTTGPDGSSQLSADDVRALAGETGDQDGAMMDGFAGPSFNKTPAGPQFATTVLTSFTRVRNCPQGGSVKLEGTHTLTFDPATRNGDVAFSATRTENACVFDRGGSTVTITSNPNTLLTAWQNWTNGVPGVRTATRKGSFTWTHSNGSAGTCDMDVTATWDLATHTLHVQGTFCNQSVDVTRTWSQS